MLARKMRTSARHVCAVRRPCRRRPCERRLCAGAVSVTLRQAHPGRVIASDFVGLSFEAEALPVLARDGTTGNLVGLLRSLRPGVLRFGWSSVDASTTFVSGAPIASPWAVTRITSGTFGQLATLLRRIGSRIILAVNLGHYNPSRAADEVTAASQRLHQLLGGVEIGNEPNAFGYTGLRAAGWDLSDYLTEFRAYRRAINRAVPGTAIRSASTS
jgi:hypothetical protein